VSVATSTSIQAGPALSVTVRAGRPHPKVVRALHAAALTTEMLPPPFATYSVRVRRLRAAATGNVPTLIVATGLPQPRVTLALHRAPSSTETVSSLPFMT
jgi:hypothetical protein